MPELLKSVHVRSEKPGEGEETEAKGLNQVRLDVLREPGNDCCFLPEHSASALPCKQELPFGSGLPQLCPRCGGMFALLGRDLGWCSKTGGVAHASPAAAVLLLLLCKDFRVAPEVGSETESLFAPKVSHFLPDLNTALLALRRLFPQIPKIPRRERQVAIFHSLEMNQITYKNGRRMYRQPCKRNEMIAVESRYSTLEHLLGNPFSFLVVLIKH